MSALLTERTVGGSDASGWYGRYLSGGSGDLGQPSATHRLSPLWAPPGPLVFNEVPELSALQQPASNQILHNNLAYTHYMHHIQAAIPSRDAPFFFLILDRYLCWIYLIKFGRFWNRLLLFPCCYLFPLLFPDLISCLVLVHVQLQIMNLLLLKQRNLYLKNGCF